VNKQFKKYGIFLFLAMALVCYFMIGFKIQRSEFYLLFFLISYLFIAYYLIIRYSNFFKVSHLLAAGIIFRCLFLFSIPTLSQDIYRFIWDGRLLLEGINPLLTKPLDVVNFQDSAWFISKMGDLSAHNYSNYPPFAQYIFAFVAFLGNGNFVVEVFIFKCILLLSDLIIYIFGRKLLTFFEQNKNQIFLYFLNPLVIIEGLGNGHFEVIMMAMFCLAIYYSVKNRDIISAIFMALAVATKLIPLFYLALKFRFKDFKRNVLYYCSFVIFIILLFMPFIEHSFFQKYLSTIGLWFGKFEFNASFYYVVRELGYAVLGYNINALYGKAIIIILISILLYFQIKFKNLSYFQLLRLFLCFLMFYFLVATTVHPWYLITLIFLNIFVNYKSVLIWSFLIFLSYFSYKNQEFKEYSIVLTLQYMLVWPVYVYELIYFNSRLTNHNEDLKTI
jgi:alpha-1,6-mannosyltransferase